MRTNLIKPKEDGISVEKVSTESGKLDMVIAFDTTGSMSLYIKEVRQHIKELIPQLFEDNPNIRISIVAFGDYCDMASEFELGNAYQVIKLTNDANALIEFVKRAKDTAGGDWEEFYELVIHKVTEETEWREGSERAVLLIADAGPHSVNYTYPSKGIKGSYDWREEARKSAKKGIKWDTTVCGGRDSWYKELSKITGGVCVPFKTADNSSEMVRATALARGGAATMDSFTKAMAECKDSEMKAVYAAYSKEVVDDCF